MEDGMPKSLVLLLSSALLAAAPAGAAIYGDTLLAAIAHRHHKIAAITLDATGTKGQSLHVAYGDMPAGSQPIEGPLADALGEPIGISAILFHGHASPAETKAIAIDLARHIYTPDNLAEADPFVEGGRRSVHGQALVDRAIAAHPHLVTLAMHVALPNEENRIVASNFGRIGKLADKDDAHVVADGAVLKEVTNGGHRLAVELPMHDASGRTIGALSTSFTIDANTDAGVASAEAIAVRNEIAKALPSLDALAH
jgi:hypothetical protein